MQDPHIETPEEKALTLAHTMAIEKLLKDTDDPAKKAVYTWHLKTLIAQKNPIMPDVHRLNSFTGTYSGNGKLTRGFNYL